MKTVIITASLVTKMGDRLRCSYSECRKEFDEGDTVVRTRGFEGAVKYYCPGHVYATPRTDP